MRALYAPVVAELPHRVANDLFERCTGVALSSRGAQGLIDSTAPDLQQWQPEFSEHLYVFANLQSPNDPAGAKAWVDQNMGALLMDRVSDVLSALKRRRPWKQAVRAALAQLIGYVERQRTRIRYQEPWQCGLAVGSGAMESACKHVIQSRFKRAGMRWKSPGFLNVLALRMARLNGTFQAFWASRGLVIQISV